MKKERISTVTTPEQFAVLLAEVWPTLPSFSHVYMSDVVEAILRAGRTPAARGRVYHVTDGSRMTICQFVERLAWLIGCPPPRKVLPYALPYLACVLFDALSALRLYGRRPAISRASLRHMGTSRWVTIKRATQELG